jgi:hypothetical protein
MDAVWHFLKHPFGTGAAAFLGTMIVSSIVLSFLIPTSCRDGWHSSSIGRRGACSWHGGVTDHGAGALSMLISLVAGVGAGMWRSAVEDAEYEREKVQREAIAETAPQPITPPSPAPLRETITCPRCGYPMQKRVARRGRNAGGYFMGCSRYPRCSGTRPITS